MAANHHRLDGCAFGRHRIAARLSPSGRCGQHRAAYCWRQAGCVIAHAGSLTPDSTRTGSSKAIDGIRGPNQLDIDHQVDEQAVIRQGSCSGFLHGGYLQAPDTRRRPGVLSQLGKSAGDPEQARVRRRRYPWRRRRHPAASARRMRVRCVPGIAEHLRAGSSWRSN